MTLKNILGINLAVGISAIALWRGDEKIEERIVGDGVKASDLLLTDLDNLLSGHGLKIKDIDEVISIVGPGGYTGIRVSISTILGLQRAVGFSVAGYNSLEVLLARDTGLRRQFALIDAGRQQFLVSHMSGDKLQPPAIVGANDIPDYARGENLQISAAVSSFESFLTHFSDSENEVIDSSSIILDLLFKLHSSGTGKGQGTLTPVYGRAFGGKD
jgi:tRNA threonylcarbamoyladenosine biosynthesis protein TsaB